MFKKSRICLLMLIATTVTVKTMQEICHQKNRKSSQESHKNDTPARRHGDKTKPVNENIEDYSKRFSVEPKLAKLIYDISKDEQIDPELVFRIIRAESRFKPDCVGIVGEIGLMQVRYGTALTIDPGATRKKLFDPAYNIRIGIKYFKEQLRFYRGDIKLALLAYNRGRGRVNELLSKGIDPANGYAARILEF